MSLFGKPPILASRTTGPAGTSIVPVPDGTMQTKCLRLMGKKLLVALTLERKIRGRGAA
jgi:hypothetical protein